MLELVSPAPTVIVASDVNHFKTTIPEPPALPLPFAPPPPLDELEPPPSPVLALPAVLLFPVPPKEMFLLFYIEVLATELLFI